MPRLPAWVTLSALVLAQAHPALAAPSARVEWEPKLVQLAPAGDHFLVTLCWGRIYCRPWKFTPEGRRWQRIYIRGEQAETSYDSAIYSKDQSAIATSRQQCSNGSCDYLSSELVLINVADGTQQTIETPQPAYLPAFGAKGQLFYWGLRSVVQARQGTTPYPARNRPVFVASHDLFAHDRQSSTDAKVVEVGAQLPLAPPKALADGRRVIVAASEIRGTVSTETGPVTPWTGAAEYGTGSVILADTGSGKMRSLIPRGGRQGLMLDVGCRDSVALIGDSGVLVAHDITTGARRVVKGGGTEPGPFSGLGVFKHAALNATCDAALTVIGRSLLWLRTQESDSGELIAPPN